MIAAADHLTASGNYQNLFIAKLPECVSNKELEDIFSAFCPSSATVMLDALTGRSKGYGFVLFDSEDSGRKAAAALDKTTASVPRSGSSHFAFELTIFASKHSGREVAAENECLYIRNIPNSWPMHEVESFIAQHGKPVYSAVRSDHHGSPVWVVFVEYDSVESARATLKAVHGTRVVQSGPPILAKYAESEEVKRNRRDRRMGRSAYRSANTARSASTPGVSDENSTTAVGVTSTKVEMKKSGEAEVVHSFSRDAEGEDAGSPYDATAGRRIDALQQMQRPYHATHYGTSTTPLSSVLSHRTSDESPSERQERQNAVVCDKSNSGSSGVGRPRPEHMNSISQQSKNFLMASIRGSGTIFAFPPTSVTSEKEEEEGAIHNSSYHPHPFPIPLPRSKQRALVAAAAAAAAAKESLIDAAPCTVTAAATVSFSSLREAEEVKKCSLSSYLGVLRGSSSCSTSSSSSSSHAAVADSAAVEEQAMPKALRSPATDLVRAIYGEPSSSLLRASSSTSSQLCPSSSSKEKESEAFTSLAKVLSSSLLSVKRGACVAGEADVDREPSERNCVTTNSATLMSAEKSVSPPSAKIHAPLPLVCSSSFTPLLDACKSTTSAHSTATASAKALLRSGSIVLVKSLSAASCSSHSHHDESCCSSALSSSSSTAAEESSSSSPSSSAHHGRGRGTSSSSVCVASSSPKSETVRFRYNPYATGM